MTKILFFLLILFSTIFCFGQKIRINDSLNTTKTIVKTEVNSADNNSSRTSKTKGNIDKKSFDWFSIYQDSLSNVIGGLIFAFILFGFNEYIFKTKNVSGEWLTTIKITQTTHPPFQNLGIEYKIHLLQLGNQISGRGEKIKDLNPNGTVFHQYPNVKRVHVEITGYYEKNFLKPSKLYLLIKENGTRRTTSASYDLTFPYFKKSILSGTFKSTAADSSGETHWKKNS